MRYESKMIELNKVEFPKFNNERVYMLPFYKKEGLPSNLSHWKKTVDQMLLQIETNDVIYLMIDQAFVKAGTPHRRPGLHIDGYWVAGSHSGRKSTNEWSSKGSHGNHKSSGSHSGHKSSKTSGNWSTSSFSEHEAILLASNVSASRAFTGQFEGPIKDMGDCDHISTKSLKEVILQENKVYAGNVTCLHESIPVLQDCFRTLVRLNVPGVEI